MEALKIYLYGDGKTIVGATEDPFFLKEMFLPETLRPRWNNYYDL